MPTRVLLACVLAATGSAALAQDGPVSSVARNPLRPTPISPPTAPGELVAERDRLWAQVRQLATNGDFPAALDQARAALELQQQHFGAEQPETCTMLDWIADWQVASGNFAAAAAVQSQRAPLCEKVYGAEHWKSIDARVYANAYRQIASLTEQDQRQLADVARIDEQVIEALAAGDYARMLEKASQTLAVRESLLGRDNIFTALSLNNVALGDRMAGRQKAARPGFEQSAAVRERLLGPNHPATLLTLTNLAAVYNELGDLVAAEPLLEKVLKICQDTRGPDHPDTLRAKGQLATFYLNQDELDKCGPMLEEVLLKLHNLHGDRNVEYAENLARFGMYHLKRGDFAAAEAITQQSAVLYQMVAGPNHPATIDAIAALGTVRQAIGKHDGAEAAFQHVLKFRRERFGNEHPEVALVLGLLANLYSSSGDYIQAEACFREALQINLNVFGADHLATAATQASIGRMLLDMQDATKAETYIQQALDTHLKILGPDHPETAKANVLLAECCQQTDRPKEAEQLYRDGLSLLVKHLGDDHPTTAACLNNLANFYEAQEDYANAQKLYEQAFNATQRKYDHPHPVQGTVLANAARTALAQGDYSHADELIEAATKNYNQTLDESHPKWIELLTIAARLDLALHKPLEARPVLERALAIARRSLESAAAIQSERQQLVSAMHTRYVLDLLLALPHEDQPAVDSIYGRVLAWKGAILARQMRGRRDTQGAVDEKLAKYQELCARISTLVLCVPEPSARTPWRDQLRDLNLRKEALESELALESHEFRQRHRSAALTPGGMRAIIPDKAALVDVLEFTQVSYPPPGESARPSYERRFVAFVVRNDRPVVCVDLGPSKPIDAAIGQWRGCRGFPSDGQSYPSATIALCDLLWTPLSPHLQGCDTVLYSPDGTLSLFPLAALPGEKPSSYLVEDVAIATIAVPQMLPEMLTPTEQIASQDPSLLLVGDIDYNAAAGSSEENSRQRAPKDQSGGQLITFSPLKSTAAEVNALTDLFETQFPTGHSTLLAREKATEASFRREAFRHRWLLLATHGFFAPPGIGGALHVHDEMAGRPRRGYHCGFLSGLAMAGANVPPAPGADDGILTAFEVSALDLANVDLVVLSGCETGLGQLAGGEGTMGLQRAFQLAGARTTVASLWTVPDQKTSQIMRRFFSNQWDRGMSKVEALREAQIWMMRTGGKATSLGEIAVDEPRLPPYHWAAFLLSGDWR